MKTRKPKLDIWYKLDIGPCSICGETIDHKHGFTLVDKKTLEPVCESCGKLYAPRLVEELEKTGPRKAEIRVTKAEEDATKATDKGK